MGYSFLREFVSRMTESDFDALYDLCLGFNDEGYCGSLSCEKLSAVEDFIKSFVMSYDSMIGGDCNG